MRGKADEAFYQTDDSWDHPRLCGEKLVYEILDTDLDGSPPPMRGKVSEKELIAKTAEGSPPPMRGKVCSKKANCSYSGITPAYAGKSQSDFQESRSRWDHPRLCGEKIPSHAESYP